jgi:hypothetical protein
MVSFGVRKIDKKIINSGEEEGVVTPSFFVEIDSFFK